MMKIALTFFLVAICGSQAIRYELKKDNKTCILLETQFSVVDPAKTFKEAVNTSGSCAPASASLKLQFDKNDSLELTFNNKADGTVSIANATLKLSGKVGYAKQPFPLSTSDKSFKCNSDSQVQLSNELTLVMRETQLQAFNIQDNKFSDATVCMNDLATDNATTTAEPKSTTTSTDSTSTSTSTSTTDEPTTSETPQITSTTTAVPPPTSTPEPPAPLLNLTVKDASGTVCIFVQMHAKFVILYENKTGESKTGDVSLPKPKSVTGTCGNSTQTLKANFFDDWTVEMSFVGDASEYRLATIALAYKESRFPDAKTPSANRTASGNSTYLKFSSDSYFTCNAKTDFKLNANVSMETTDLKVQAFRTTNSSTGFDGTQVQCNDDLPVDNIVPIIVGAALAALVIIVLVAYIIGRRRQSGGGYQSV